ncbi:MAG: DUF4097 domain-containing protein [Acidimicrobiia bacterium]|nr:DUF4097 domain-containing protein [Acidimicrobiia bacterium]
MEMIATYWPFILVAWGVIRLIEILAAWMGSKQLPRHGVSGGEWVFIVFISLVGCAVFYGSRYTKSWPTARISMHGLEVFGESYDFPFEGKTVPAGKTPRMLVENLRGNARIVAADTEEITVKGRTTVRAFQRADAEKVNKNCPLEIVKRGDLFVVRTNHDKAEGAMRITSDLEITVPRAASLEGRGRYGDFDITGVAGNVEINSDNAGVRVNDIGGGLRVDLRRSDIIRAVNVKGGVEVKGSGWDVELENIEGPATVNGSYSGELIFRNLAKPLRFDSASTELRVERITGQLRMGRGELHAHDVTGPVHLRTSSKDVEISDFTQGLEISLDRGDIELRPGKLPLSQMNVKTKSGDVQISIPPAAKFEIRATTSRGEAENDFGAPLDRETFGRRATIVGTTGTGPALQLATDRGTVIVRKASSELIPPPPAPPAAPAPAAPKAPKASSLPVDHQ